MAKTGIIRRKKTDNLSKILKKLSTGPDSLPRIAEYWAARTALIAKRSMPKAPKSTKNKKRLGTFKAYGKSTKSYQKGKRYYFSKGLYSPPGQPPFWHPKGPNPKRRGKASLKLIKYVRVGSATHWRVGPEYFPQRGSIPVPALHEHGGVAKMRTKNYYDRAGKKHARLQSFTARYPPRPYMKPAFEKAKHDKQRGRSIIDRINNAGGMKASRRVR